MKGILKITIVAIITLCLCAIAIAVDLPKKAGARHAVPLRAARTPSIRRVILPADKKLEKIPPKKKPSRFAEQDFSPFLTKNDAATLREALKAYRADNISGAISETKRLLKEKGSVAEVAAYFLGEFYLKQAEKGDKEAIPQAMSSFQKAVLAYPKSDRVTFGYLRMGEIYTRQRLFYEGIGSFKRIVARGLDDPITLQAKIGIAKAYQAWGKWAEAKEAYGGLLRGAYSPETTSIALFGQTDALYQMGQFEEAYQSYKKAATAAPSYRFSDPAALFQFGEAAYRTRHHQDAKSAFLDFYNIYPKHTLAAVALVREKTLLAAPAPGGNTDLVGPVGKKATREAMEARRAASHMQKVTLVTPHFPSIDDSLRRLALESIRASANDPASNLGRILLAMEAIQKCLKTVSLKMQDVGVPQSCNRPLAEEAFYPPSQLRLDLLEGIKTNAIDLLNSAPPSTTAQGIILDAIYQLKKYKEIEAVVEIETTLLINLPVSSPYIQEVESTLHETIATQFETIRDPEKIVTLYYAYPAAFTKQMLSGEIGYIIAMSHIRTGLLSKGVALLKPVSENVRYPLWKEAIYQIGKASLALSDYGKAQQALEEYQRLSPEGEKAYADLGHLHFKRGDSPKAVLAYERWLSHFSKHPDRADIYLKLSEAYRYLNDFDNEIKVYSRWIAEGKREKAGLDVPYMRLADTYFQSAQYKKAIASYRSILEDGNVGEKEMEWARLRLATSYELSGQEKEGKKYFENVSQKTKNLLIRQIASEKMNPS